MRSNLSFLFPLAAMAAPATAQTLLALTANNSLQMFLATAPAVTGPTVPITGLQPGETIVGIDVRPATGQLYGLGSDSRLYRIDPANGVATAVGGQFATLLQGSHFGFDFNPVVDRVRIVGDQGQNLRVHPDTGVVVAVDGALAFAPGDVHFGSAPMIAGGAYANNVAGATFTTLFDIDTGLDVLVTQIPPNSGTLNTIGRLGRDVTAVAGFDIAPGSGIAFAALDLAGALPSAPSQLFTIDLTHGTATWVAGIGLVGSAATRVLGLTVLPEQPRADAVALTDDNRLLAYDANAPWLATPPVTVSGLQAGEQLLAIDFRPATGALYGLGDSGRLYTIDAATGMAVAVGSPLTTPLVGSAFGFDFNPTVDRIRVVSDGDQNLRLHPDTGAVVAVDGALAFAAGDVHAGQDPMVVASAYTNNLPGATATLLYGIDVGHDVLVTQVPPNSGTLNTVGALGIDVTAVAGFDIAPGSGVAFALLATNGGSGLWRIELATGAATPVGAVGATAALGTGLRGLAVQPVAGLRLQGQATAGCQGLPAIGAFGRPLAGSNGFQMTAGNVMPGTMTFFAVCGDVLPMPLVAGGLLVQVDPATVLMVAPLLADAGGAARLPLQLPGHLAGTRMGLQFIAADACSNGGLAGSSGLQVTLQ
ncbi:MAG: DUF4394 domain-containing protein [Planctomycetes bacterium]|nr:DUF4394 domain-containing protein [Planctomycetota bacterium]